jgi:hypothetical protein
VQRERERKREAKREKERAYEKEGTRKSKTERETAERDRKDHSQEINTSISTLLLVFAGSLEMRRLLPIS